MAKHHLLLSPRQAGFLITHTHAHVAFHLFYMLAYLFTQQMSVELLLCTRHGPRCCGSRRDQSKVPAFGELKVKVSNGINEQIDGYSGRW